MSTNPITPNLMLTHDSSTNTHLSLGFRTTDKKRYIANVIKNPYVSEAESDIEVFFSKITEIPGGGRKFSREIKKARGVIYFLNSFGIVQEELFHPLLTWELDARPRIIPELGKSLKISYTEGCIKLHPVSEKHIAAVMEILIYTQYRLNLTSSKKKSKCI